MDEWPNVTVDPEADITPTRDGGRYRGATIQYARVANSPIYAEHDRDVGYALEIAIASKRANRIHPLVVVLAEDDQQRVHRWLNHHTRYRR